ncbi:MAG: CHASE2 domain-containing protein, partial [Proteobacteria bacterium]|nr:CHASE2 domain-containing protein [Pseudomonadota bacterium]
MTLPRLSRILHRIATREWLTILLCLLILAAELGWQNGLGRLDQTLYDGFTTFNSRPARDDIIIVAIDDYSLAQLGRWPWPRKLHAQLLDRLSAAKPRAIGLDVILTEPERPDATGKRPGDDAIAAALRLSGKTVLPVVVANLGAGMAATLPVDAIGAHAKALGHINLEHDNDGVVRSVFLYEGQNGAWWPHFALALARTGGADLARLMPLTDEKQRPGNWVRTREMHIPFAGGNGHFRSVPYVAVLNGEVPAQFFTDKYVLVGATAIGMTDSYPTAVSGESGAMPGVEINANILSSLLDGKSVRFARPWQTALFSVLPVLLALLGFVFLRSRLALLLGASLLLATLGASYLVLCNGIWLPPAAALIVLLISYPLWSWRRLEAAIAYLSQEFMRLDKEPHLLPEAAPTAAPVAIEDELEHRIKAMETAARRVRDLRQFISDSLDSLPDATLVT